MSTARGSTLGNKPEKVKTDDLHQENNKLYSAAFIQEMRELKLPDNSFYSRADIEEQLGLSDESEGEEWHENEVKYDVIKTGNTLFAIYHTILGKGMFGDVYAAQNLESGEWIVVKKFLTSKLSKVEEPFIEGFYETAGKLSRKNQSTAEIQNYMDSFTEERERFHTKHNPALIGAQHEHSVLMRIGDIKGELISCRSKDIDGKDSLNYYLPMAFAPGKTLSSIINNNPSPLTIQQITTIATDYLQQLSLLLDKGIILRDMHFNNIVYNADNGKLKIIDHGDDLLVNPSARKAEATPMGSDPFVAPEVLQAIHLQVADLGEKKANPRIQVEYNEKTTVYSYGAMLAALYGLATTEESPYLKEPGDSNKPPILSRTIKLHDEKVQTSKINNPLVRRQMLRLIEQMTDKDPTKRPTLALAGRKLARIQDSILTLQTKTSTLSPTVTTSRDSSPSSKETKTVRFSSPPLAPQRVLAPSSTQKAMEKLSAQSPQLPKSTSRQNPPKANQRIPRAKIIRSPVPPPVSKPVKSTQIKAKKPNASVKPEPWRYPKRK